LLPRKPFTHRRHLVTYSSQTNKPKRRFRTQIFWSIVPIFLIIFISFGYFSLRMQESLAEKEFLKRGELIATNLAHSAKLGVYAENKPLLDTAINSAMIDTDVIYVLIYNQDAQLIASAGSEAKRASVESLDIVPELLGQKPERIKAVITRIDRLGINAIDYVAPILFRIQALPDEELLGSFTDSSKLLNSEQFIEIGYVRVGLSSKSLEQSGINILKLWGGLIVAIAVFSALIILFLSRRITKPINRLTIGAEKIAQGHLEEMIPVSSNDEIGQLALTFNNMAKALHGNIAQKLSLLDEVQSLNLNLEERINERTAELHERTTALEQASRHKSEFLANMSHELRTPLNAIIGYSEMLEEDAKEDGLDNYATDLKKIQSAGRHLLSLINDVLDLSKIEAGRMELRYEYFSVKTLIQDVLETVEPQAKINGNRIDVNYLTPVDQMESDLVRVRQCLINLLSNACKFTENGSIAIEIDTRIQQADEQIIFRIADTGIGIAEEKLEHIFDEFRQADSSTTRKFGGTGLGLAISQKFCKMLGGKISVTSRCDIGSRFTVCLPLFIHHEQSSDTIEAGYGKLNTVLNGEHSVDRPLVLVIDDDAAARDLMERYLKKDGFAVQTCASGREGLALARRLSPIAITLDVLMPGMDGWDVLKTLKADPQLADIPVIMNSMVDDRSTGYVLGATEYLTKPIDRDQLSVLLKSHQNKFDGESLLGESLLLVEDDVDAGLLIQRCCEKQGWRVATAHNGLIAIGQMKKSIPDLIILDLMMPKMDGFEFLFEIRKNKLWVDIPVIILTSMDLNHQDRQRLNGNFVKILNKSGVNHAELMNEISNIISHAKNTSITNRSAALN